MGVHCTPNSGESPGGRCRPHGFRGRGWGHKHAVINQAGAEWLNRLALTASQKTSDKEEGGNQASGTSEIISVEAVGPNIRER